jgi:two-component sensor histidine kinase
VLGGAVGGALTGIYAARAKRRTREAAGQADRLHLLNRLLRDEILNSITVVLGHAEALAQRDDDEDTHTEPITRNAEHIRGVVEDVGSLTADGAPGDRVLDTFVVGDVLDAEIETLRAAYPDAEFSVEGDTDACAKADEQLSLLFEQLVHNAVEHNPDPNPKIAVTVTETPTAVEVAITDDGVGMGESERSLLESGALDRYDQPSEGFGLWISRILLDRYEGRARVSIDSGTTVTVVLPRGDISDRNAQRSNSIGISPHQIGIASAAGVLAGIVMGFTFQFASDTIPVIGAMYGSSSVGVGWVTHMFHSVVFATIFAAVLSHPRLREIRQRFEQTFVVAIVFGVGLWLIAAGIVMPAWLRLVGIETPIPRLDSVALVGHLLWASVLASSYWGLREL